MGMMGAAGIEPATSMGIKLVNGEAEAMGEGVFVVLQTCEFEGCQSVVLTRPDLEAMLGRC